MAILGLVKPTNLLGKRMKLYQNLCRTVLNVIDLESVEKLKMEFAEQIGETITAQTVVTKTAVQPVGHQKGKNKGIGSKMTNIWQFLNFKRSKSEGVI
jgi:hypothetical protein